MFFVVVVVVFPEHAEQAYHELFGVSQFSNLFWFVLCTIDYTGTKAMQKIKK